MRTLLVLLLTAIAALAAEDGWAKVRELKSGTEIRIVRKGTAKPIVAKFGDTTESSLVIIVKNEETAIPKEEIDRIDFRPAQPGGRVVKETRTTDEARPEERGKRTTGVQNSVVIRDKLDFEVLYRRPAGAPPKAK